MKKVKMSGRKRKASEANKPMALKREFQSVGVEGVSTRKKTKLGKTRSCKKMQRLENTSSQLFESSNHSPKSPDPLEFNSIVHDDVQRNKRAENVEISIRANKFAHAFEEIKKLSIHDDFRLKLLLAESALRSGRVEATREAISDLACYISASEITADELYEWGTMYVKDKKRIDSAKGMVLLACAASLFANISEDSNNSVHQIGMCIYHFSNAIRKIPITKSRVIPRQKAIEIVGHQKKKFKTWHEALQTFEPIMKSMFDQMMEIEGVNSDKKNSSAAWAQNWMAASYLYIGQSHLSKVEECCHEGMAFAKNINCRNYTVQKTEIDLNSNLGQALANMGRSQKGRKHLEKAIKMAEELKPKCKKEQKKDLKKCLKFMEKTLKFVK